jgi:hypothetical protein
VAAAIVVLFALLQVVGPHNASISVVNPNGQPVVPHTDNGVQMVPDGRA